MDLWDINNGGIHVDLAIPVAIPSFNREAQLVDQTLNTLSFYGWNLSLVHIFVHPSHIRDNGISEGSAYRRHLRASGYGEVKLHRGGANLMKQYACIFAYFAGQKMVILSDTVPGIIWRRHQTNLTTQPLPSELLHRIVNVMFCVIEKKKWHTWSLSPCKGPHNLQPGHISQKCGLLDGNFFGVNLRILAAPTLSISNFTTDVEFSLRMWTRDGGFARLLGVSALHQYRQVGGHSVFKSKINQRISDTEKAIRQLGHLFPQLIKFVPDKKTSDAGMKYVFVPKGGPPFLLKGTYTNRGRHCADSCRAKSVAERVRKHRRLKTVISVMKVKHQCKHNRKAKP
jgi:hypothetical protein